MVAISEVAEINPGFPRTENLAPDSLVSFLPMAAVSEFGIIITQDERQFAEVSKGYTYFAEGDVLMAKITPCMENGKATFVQNLKHRAGFGSTEFHVLRPSSEIDGKYLFYMIWNPAFRKVAERNMTGTAGQKRVPSSFLKEFKIPLPPLPEQKRIAAILDKADSIRRKRQEAVRLSEELLRSVFLDMFGDPVTNERGWKYVRMEEIASKEKYSIVDGPFGASLKQEDYYDSGIPIIRIKNISSEGEFIDNDFLYIKESKFNELKRSSVKKNDLLISRVGTLGNTCIYPGTYEKALLSTTGVCKIQLNSNITNNKFIHRLILMNSFQKQIKESASTSVQAYFNLTALKNWKLILPPIEKQNIFAKFVDNVSVVKSKACLTIDSSDTLFNSLLQRAFIGGL